MRDIPKIFHAMLLLSDADAAKKAAEILRSLSEDITDAEVQAMYTAAANDFFESGGSNWNSLLDAISLVAVPSSVNNACDTSEHDTPPYLHTHQTIFSKLAAFCTARQKRLDAIEQTITTGAMRFVPTLTNLDKNNICTELKRRITALGLADISQFSLQSSMTAAQILGLLAAMREAVTQRNIGAAYADARTIDVLDELEALYGVLLNYFNERQHRGLTVSFSLCTLPGFVYCDKCWRLIPKGYARRQKARCDVHNYETGKSTDSRKGNAVHGTLVDDNPVFPREVEKKLAALNAAWKPAYGGISEDAWWHVFENDLTAPQIVAVLPTVQYSLSLVWEVCPHVCQLILDNGGNSDSAESAIAILDPHMQDEIPEEHTARATLHTFLAKNFWYYRQELALAETWLTQYATLYADKKHGGPRANSGGKRPGAGRPKKSSPQL